jgi:hypothetical protein
MIQSIRRETIALGLLNTLETERYVRGPLLVEVIETISQDERFAGAVRLAETLLDRLEEHAIADGEFVRAIGELRNMIVTPARAERPSIAQTPRADASQNALARTPLRNASAA